MRVASSQIGPSEELMEIAHILVAEDDADTRELVELVLRRARFRVSVTDDWSEVLNVLTRDQFDALSLDNCMASRVLVQRAV
jgi:DNA-binding response OmpR family regulator